MAKQVSRCEARHEEFSQGVEWFAGAGLEKGTYQAALIMYSNDPEQPTTRLPVQLEIN